MAKPFQLPQDFLDFFEALNEHRVEYAVVGAYAMAAWGYTRATGDIDVWVLPSQENAERLIKSLAKFGAPLQGVGVQDFTKSGTVFQIGQPPLRIDILTSLDGIKIPKSLSHLCNTTDTLGPTIPVLALDVLIENKRATGRKQDLADIEVLEQIRKKNG